jgi:hypothetical protein
VKNGQTVLLPGRLPNSYAPCSCTAHPDSYQDYYIINIVTTPGSLAEIHISTSVCQSNM